MATNILRYIFILLFLITIISCDNTVRTNDNNTNEGSSDSLMQFATKQVAKSSINGAKVFKNNCTVCHCPPSSNCEPSEGPHLINLFTNLPKDSLDYFVDYIKDSKTLKNNGDKSNNQMDEEVSVNFEHCFGKTLSKQELEDVILYLWIDAKGRNTRIR